MIISIKQMAYNLVITGTIGAGKTTLINRLCEVLQATIYPEYLDYNIEESQKMLERKLKNEISTFRFQDYVLSVMEEIAAFNTTKQTVIRIFERTIDETVLCFAAPFIDNIREIQLLYKKAIGIATFYNLPTYSDKNEITVVSNPTVEQITEIINRDLKIGIKTRFIFLDVSLDEELKRIKKRNRESENEYSINTLQKYLKIYKTLSEFPPIKNIDDVIKFKEATQN